MSKISSINQNEVRKTRGTLKQSGSNEMTKGKRQCKTSRCLMANKENTPPVFTRSKSRTLKSVNKNNVESIPSSKTSSKLKKNEVKENLNRTPLKPVKAKPEPVTAKPEPKKAKPLLKVAKNCRMSLNFSPIHQPKFVCNSGRKDLTTVIFEGTEDDIASISHIVFRRRSSNGIQKEASILTSANPPSDYWKMLAEDRLNAIEKTRHENELMYDQLSVLEAENSQLKEMVKRAKEIINIVQSAL